MRWTRFARHALTLTLAVGLAACGDDDPTDPDNEGDLLTEVEAESMIEALAEAGGFGFGIGLGAGASATAPEGVTIGPVTFEETTACPQGGSIAMAGSYSADIDDETGHGTYQYELVQTHDACTATAASDGSTWTFDGSPDITIDFAWTFDQTAYEFQGTQTGGIAFSGSGKSGTCQIDLTYDFSGDQSGTTYSGSVAGSVCGVSVSHSTTISD